MTIALSNTIASAVLYCTASVPSADVFVDLNAANCTAGTGTASDPVCTIGAGVALASPGDTIRIAPGTYVENLTLGFDLDLIGTGGAAITIVDGGDFPGSSNPERVITIQSAVTVAIEGLTISNGRSKTTNGGGISVGGILLLTNSTITGNGTSRLGGGLYGAPGSDITLENCLVERNESVSDYGNLARGGGVFVRGGDLTILSSTVSENRAYSYLGDASCSFPIGYGGGGVAFFSDGELLIANSTISDNRATCDGGGVVILQQSSGVAGDARLTNSTISGNVANYGGAMLGTRMILENVTITDNLGARSYLGQLYYQPGAWGGIAAYGQAADHSIHNSLIAGNARDNINSTSVGSPSDLAGMVLSLGHNVIGALSSSSSGPINVAAGDQIGSIANPIAALLGPLRNNGGPTETHAILLGSPALDHGDPQFFEPLDQRGRVRPTGAASDVGATEQYLSDISLCNGDGGNQTGCTDCPCGNNSSPGTVGGCINSSGASSQLQASGDPSVSLPPLSSTDLRFDLSGIPPTALCILFSGSAVAPESGLNPCFMDSSGVQAVSFDGLRCAILNLRRHGTRTADSNGEVGVSNAPWGGDGAPPAGIAVAFGGFAAGQTRYFQAIHREDPLSVCLRGLNTTQAVGVVFTP